MLVFPGQYKFYTWSQESLDSRPRDRLYGRCLYFLLELVFNPQKLMDRSDNHTKSARPSPKPHTIRKDFEFTFASVIGCRMESYRMLPLKQVFSAHTRTGRLPMHQCEEIDI